MAEIRLTTFIDAPIQTCFDLSRSVDVHLRSTAKTKERVISGRTSGLCELNDEITWEARHFGVRQQLTVRITKMEEPIFFEDVMLKGAFSSMRHEHHFKKSYEGTEMSDIFSYKMSMGILSRIVENLILKKYMTNFLLKRNQTIKELAILARQTTNSQL